MPRSGKAEVPKQHLTKIILTEAHTYVEIC